MLRDATEKAARLSAACYEPKLHSADQFFTFFGAPLRVFLDFDAIGPAVYKGPVAPNGMPLVIKVLPIRNDADMQAAVTQAKYCHFFAEHGIGPRIPEYFFFREEERSWWAPSRCFLVMEAFLVGERALATLTTVLQREKFVNDVVIRDVVDPPLQSFFEKTTVLKLYGHAQRPENLLWKVEEDGNGGKRIKVVSMGFGWCCEYLPKACAIHVCPGLAQVSPYMRMLVQMLMLSMAAFLDARIYGHLDYSERPVLVIEDLAVLLTMLNDDSSYIPRHYQQELRVIDKDPGIDRMFTPIIEAAKQSGAGQYYYAYGLHGFVNMEATLRMYNSNTGGRIEHFYRSRSVPEVLKRRNHMIRTFDPDFAATLPRIQPSGRENCHNDEDLQWDPIDERKFVMTMAGNCLSHTDAVNLVKRMHPVRDPYTFEPIEGTALKRLRAFAEDENVIPVDNRLDNVY